jgi:2-aminoadipate transaminase
LTLSVDRREKLVELARRFSTNHRILILEDTAYRELRYSGDDLPSVKSFDTRNEHVIYAGTFSKACAPGLKTGFALMPREVMAPMMHLKGSHDFGSGNLAQHIVSKLLATGVYSEHVEKLRKMYRRKRDALVAALDREFGDMPGATWTVPSGGLFSWLSLEGIDTGPRGNLVQAALEAGVLYVPGEFGHVSEGSGPVPTHEIRICFGVATPELIAVGIHRLRLAVDSVSVLNGQGRRLNAVTS